MYIVHFLWHPLPPLGAAIENDLILLLLIMIIFHKEINSENLEGKQIMKEISVGSFVKFN